MFPLLHRFVEAHDRYLALDGARTDCRNPQERDLFYIELLKAYLEVQFYARQIAGQQFADGNDYCEMN